MLDRLKAIIYALFHPQDPVYLTVVRRYVDAKKCFIGELYLGEGRAATMIGMSCDTLPFNVGDGTGLTIRVRLEFHEDFLAPMSPGGLRVGGIEPSTNDAVRQIVSLRRYCPIRVQVLNRFIEHVLEKDHA